MDLTLSVADLPKAGFILMLIVAVVSVAVADVCLKQATVSGSVQHAFGNHWTWVAVALYLLQIALFVVVFANGWDLSVVGMLQTTLYAVVTIGAGLLLFGEALTLERSVGIVLGFVAVVLMSR